MTESKKKPVLRAFVAGRFGQVHLREIAAESVEREPPLMCLHPAPYSGLYFSTVMPLLNRHRRIIAPDYPGYGASAAPPFQPTIDDYALAMLDTASALEFAEIDVLGFHTGCLVAAEMSLRQASVMADFGKATDSVAGGGTCPRVRSLILVDVPYFVGAERSEKLSGAAQPLELGPDIKSITERWQFNVASRAGVVPLERSVNLFCDSLSDASGAHWAFAAAREYPCEERLRLIETPCTVIATDSSLQGPTRLAADVLRNAQLIECSQIKQAVFEAGAADIADTINKISVNE